MKQYVKIIKMKPHLNLALYLGSKLTLNVRLSGRRYADTNEGFLFELRSKQEMFIFVSPFALKEIN